MHNDSFFRQYNLFYFQEQENYKLIIMQFFFCQLPQILHDTLFFV